MKLFKIFLIFVMSIMTFTTTSQVSTAYTFSETAGTYTAIVGGTQLVTTTAGATAYDTDGSYVTLPSASQFYFNGALITAVNMTADGSLYLNPGTSTTGNGTAGSIASSDVARGIISALNMNLRSTSLASQVYERRWQDDGTEVIFQWQNCARSAQNTVERFSFQVRITKTSGVVKIVYGNMTTISSSTTLQPYVGLRGTSNTDFNNRRLTNSVPDNSPNWGAPNGTTAGTTNSHTCRFLSTGTCYPSLGLTFIWTPSPTIITSGTLTAFSSCANSASTSQSFTVAGYGLTSNITVTAPTGFQVSTDNSTFSSSVALTQTGGGVSLTTVYVRMSSLASSPSNGNVTCSATSSTTQNIAASGTVVSLSPSITTSPSSASVSVGGNVTFTSVIANSPTSYTWQVSTDGGSNWATISDGGVYSNTNTPSLTITNSTLSMNGYQYKVLGTNCVGSSSYSSVATLTVTYCIPVSSGNTVYINNFSTSNGITNISNLTTTTSVTSAGYSNYYNTMSCSQYPNTSISFSISTNTSLGGGFAIYVDWNNDGTFALSERMYTSNNNGVVSTGTLSFTVPNNQPIGDYRMRVSFDYNASNPGSCPSTGSIECEDYKFTVSELVAPIITSFTPSSVCGSNGSTVVITGSNFIGTSSVTIGGTSSTFTVNSSTQITVTVGSGSTGVISVTSAGGTSTSSSNLTVNTPPTVSYNGSPFSYTNNTTISGISPTTTGSPTSFSVGTTLPSGLNFNTSSGEITGTPTVVSNTTSYVVTGTNINGCTGSATINISVGPDNISCSSAPYLTCGSSVSGSTIGTSGTAHGLPGTYSVSNYGVWYKLLGDGFTYNFTVTPSSGYDIEVDIVSGSCGTFTTVSSTDIVGAGVAETITLTTTNSTTYYIYIAQYASGNTTTGSFTLDITSTPPTPTGLTGPSVLCLGSTGTYSVTNVSGMSYVWTLPSGWSGTSSTNSITVTPNSTAGMIYVSSSFCGNTSNKAAISVGVNIYPTSVNAGNDVSICLGSNTTLNASASNGSVTLFNTDATYGTGWSASDVNRWGISNTSNAGGSAKEFRFTWYASGNIDATLQYTNPINATNYTSTALVFRHSVDWLSGTTGFTLYVETSTDNTNWTSRWSITPTADVSFPGGTTVNVDLSALNGTSFYLRYRFIGSTGKINDWFIDNISVTATPTISYSWVNTTTGLSSTNVNNPIASPTSTTIYTVQSSAGGCTSNDQVQVTVNSSNITLNSPHFIWTGKVDGSYSNSSNWMYTNGSVISTTTSTPTSADDVVIPSGVCIVNYPIITTNQSSDSLTISNGASITLNGGTFTANDDVVVKPGGTLTMANGSTLTVVDGSVKFLGNSTFTPGNGTIKINHLGVENHYLITESSTNNTFYKLEFMGDNDPSDPDFMLGSTINCTNEFKVTSKNVKLNNYNVLFGTTGYLTEGSNGKKVYDLGSGYLESIKTIDGGTTVTPGDMGLTITTDVSKQLGYTVIRRYHSPVNGYLAGNTTSIGRYYSVSPTYNGDSYGGNLNATVTFNYKTSDLNGHDTQESLFTIYRKGSTETSWQQLGGVVDVSSKTVTFSNFPKFSDVTLGPMTQTALSVELLSFDCVNKGDDNYLFWVTSSEHNTSHFNVQKSRDGESWMTITTINAAVNSTHQIDYDVVDYKVEPIINYYRLQQYDNDGVYEIYGPISINNMSTQMDKIIVKYIDLNGREINPDRLHSMEFYIEIYNDGSMRKMFK